MILHVLIAMVAGWLRVTSNTSSPTYKKRIASSKPSSVAAGCT